MTASPANKEHPVHLRTALAVLGALVVAIATASADASPDATVARASIGPYTTAHSGVVVDAGITAEAHVVTTPSGRTIVRVTAEGLTPGGNYAAHVHYGACTDYLGHFQYAHPGPATRENEVWLDLDADASGRASDQVQVASFDLGQSLSLVVHQHSNPDTGPGAGPPGPRIACGNLELDG
jgi:Cu/Zn superoxide dismutase